jgi:hypothetical protein
MVKGLPQMSMIQMTAREFAEAIQEARALGWDQCVASMTYTDGSPVDVALNSNPYRSKR